MSNALFSNGSPSCVLSCVFGTNKTKTWDGIGVTRTDVHVSHGSSFAWKDLPPGILQSVQARLREDEGSHCGLLTRFMKQLSPPDLQKKQRRFSR